jgi:hypothetical protein
VREIVLLPASQRVHVGAKPIDLPLSLARPANHRDHPRAADTRMMLDAECGQLLANEPRRRCFLEAQLGWPWNRAHAEN